MFADQKYRVVSYHDTWISADPIRGCPYSCGYCVLRHGNGVGVRPAQVVEPSECVRLIKSHPFYVATTPIALGNETDLFHNHNVDYMIALLREMRAAGIDNTIVLITKAPLTDEKLSRVAQASGANVVLFLSYSGLTQVDHKYEPNFTDEQLRRNFLVARNYNFRIVHFWRPLLPVNTTEDAIRQMLTFVAGTSDATVFVGLKLHPELTKHIVNDGGIEVPQSLYSTFGEWIEEDAVRRIYEAAKELCPDYPLYRHSACALAKVLSRPNHTATIFRTDICPPSHCPSGQRRLCEQNRRVPEEVQITDALRVLGRPIQFERHLDRVVVKEEVTQEEYAFLLHCLNCPLVVDRVIAQNLYRGSIYMNQVFG